MSPTRGLVIAIASSIVVIIATLFISLPKEQNLPTVAQDSEGKGSLTILTISEGSLLTGGNYSISPNPFTGKDTYSIQDGGQDDANHTAGIIEISGLHNGNFTVTQTDAPPGYPRDKNAKTIEIKNDGAVATFANTLTQAATNSPVNYVIYTSKFECGTIAGNEGPLRPGHYDTDISIFNKQDFELHMTWTAVLNDGKSTNSILKTLKPQSSTGVVCKDLRPLIGSDKFAEGFVVVNIPFDSGLQNTLSGGTAIVGRQGTSVDLLDVQVFYTANALDELPHEVLVDKIVFTITADKGDKVPQEMIGKTLDVTVRSDIGKVADPVEKVRAALADQYELSAQEASALDVKVESVSVGAGTMIDDHAISLSRVPPQTSS